MHPKEQNGEVILMKKWQMSSIFIILAVLLAGTAGAATPITVGASWSLFDIPPGTPPVASTNNPFTYSSNVATRIKITDLYCVGDRPAVYEGGVLLGTGTPVVSQDPLCTDYIDNSDQAYASSLWSHACINMAPGSHAFDVVNVEMWNATQGDGGALMVEAGVCPEVPGVPEFPSAALPAGMILGTAFVVFTLWARQK
jgi:hypothetical protein